MPRRRRRTCRLEMFYAVLPIGAVALWIAARLGTVAALLAGIAWAVAAYSMLLTPPTPPMPRSEVTSARLEAVHLITKSPARSYGTRHRSRRDREPKAKEQSARPPRP